MTVITRFAPSPTGHLHIGNIRTAIINWLFARNNNGKFILRIDDTDKERSKDEYVNSIMEDLKWLGLDWDEIYFQSKRMDLYNHAKTQMIKSGRLYPCFETQEELEIKKKILLSRNLPPIYDRTALNLSDAQINEYHAKGVNPHYRFKLSDDKIVWYDGVRQQIEFDPKKISDPVLIRADGTMTYMIATVVDDIDLKITDIIRGEDHISNSAIHVQMFAALGGRTPNLSHISLIKSSEGKISKRKGGFEIKALREAGIHPMAILSFFTKLGSSDSIEYKKTTRELINEFSLKKYGKSTTNYDLTELERLNTKLTHNLSYNDIKYALPQEIDENFWESIKHNLNNSNEIKDWWTICKGTLSPVVNDTDFVLKTAELLPDGIWDENTWGIWINRIKAETGRSGKNLFMPIRLALTAQEQGPELKTLLPVLGREKTLARLHSKEA